MLKQSLQGFLTRSDPRSSKARPAPSTPSPYPPTATSSTLPSVSTPCSASTGNSHLSIPPVASPTCDLRRVIGFDTETITLEPAAGESSRWPASVGLVNGLGEPLYYAFIAPPTDRTVINLNYRYSGITWQNLSYGLPKSQVAREVAEILATAEVVTGSSVGGDFKVLGIEPELYSYKVRDSVPLGGGGLAALVQQHFGVSVQEGTHNALADAHCSAMLYAHNAAHWEVRQVEVDEEKERRRIEKLQKPRWGRGSKSAK